MRITVTGLEHDRNLVFPTGLLLNWITVFYIVRKAKKHGVALEYRQMVKLIKILNDYRRTHKDWILMELERAGGNMYRSNYEIRVC